MRPAVVYDYSRWQLLQIKETKLGVSHQLHWETLIFCYCLMLQQLRRPRCDQKDGLNNDLGNALNNGLDNGLNNGLNNDLNSGEPYQ